MRIGLSRDLLASHVSQPERYYRLVWNLKSLVVSQLVFSRDYRKFKFNPIDICAFLLASTRSRDKLAPSDSGFMAMKRRGRFGCVPENVFNYLWHKKICWFIMQWYFLLIRKGLPYTLQQAKRLTSSTGDKNVKVVSVTWLVETRGSLKRWAAE